MLVNEKLKKSATMVYQEQRQHLENIIFKKEIKNKLPLIDLKFFVLTFFLLLNVGDSVDALCIYQLQKVFRVMQINV